MVNIAEMMPSKYLRAVDCKAPKVLTIAGVKNDNVALESQEPKMRWILLFKEPTPGLVLNSTNLKRLALGFGDDSDAWIGKRIQVYVDPTVSFGGKETGGLRIRTPKPGSGSAAAPVTPPPKPVPTPPEAVVIEEGFDHDEDLPFDDDISSVPF